MTVGRRLHGNPDDSISGGWWWFNSLNQDTHRQLDPKIIIQPFGLNEQNQPRDAWFYLGLMKAADQQGRKLAIFGGRRWQPRSIRRA
jgi:hypothetical protein